MAQQDRRYAGHTTVLSVDGNDIIGLFTDTTLSLKTDTQEARAALDAWHWPVGDISGCEISINKVVEDEGADLALALAGAAVPVLWESSSVDGLSASGNFLLTGYDHSITTGDGQKNALTLVCQGQPAIVRST